MVGVSLSAVVATPFTTFDFHPPPKYKNDMKVANSKARQKVMNRQEFTGSNTFGRWTLNNYYVVYSYGEHFPLYVWNPNNCNWYVNTDKYSTSTSRHKSQLSPLCHCIEMNTSELKSIINHS